MRFEEEHCSDHRELVSKEGLDRMGILCSDSNRAIVLVVLLVHIFIQPFVGMKIVMRKREH